VRFALKIDHQHCWGCKACEVACKQENQANRGVKLIHVGDEAATDVDGKLTFTFKPTICHHCENPPCAEACPADVIARRRDGIVLLDSDLCTGCGSCLDACPYNAISMDKEKGVAQKCNMCHHRVEKGLIPACADNVCLAHCIYFGDANRMDDMIAEKVWLGYRMREKLSELVITVED
jgi:tetrathionate reductase subunit B